MHNLEQFVLFGIEMQNLILVLRISKDKIEENVSLIDIWILITPHLFCIS